MSLVFLALATKTSWPHSSNTLLAHGEWVPASIAMRMGCSEAKRRLKVSGLVRSLPSSIISPLSVSMRHRGRSTCLRGPIRLSCVDALCYHPLRADPPFHIGPLEPVECLQTLRVLRTWGVGLLISSSENYGKANFVELRHCEVRRTPPYI